MRWREEYECPDCEDAYRAKEWVEEIARCLYEDGTLEELENAVEELSSAYRLDFTKFYEQGLKVKKPGQETGQGGAN